MPSDFVRNTPTALANIRAVVALSKTVPSTIIKTKGVIYSAPTSLRNINFEPKSEAIPAATIPLGPTQPMNNFSLNFKLDPDAEKYNRIPIVYQLKIGHIDIGRQ